MIEEPTRDDVERFEEILAQLEVTAGQLRRDPQGHGWLPAEARALLQSDPECARLLHEYVQDELSLMGALAEPPRVAPVPDPFFTARVVEALPRLGVPNRLSPRRRLAVLGAFHLVAVLLTVLVLAMVPESTERWAEGAHSVLSWGSAMGPSPWLLGMGVAAVALALFAGRSPRSMA